MPLITKIVKRYNRKSWNSQPPSSVTIYTADSETKKRQGYCTVYTKKPGKQVYGVTFRGYYEQGKLSGTVFKYSMFYPNYVLPGHYYNLASASNYKDGKLHGVSIAYDKLQQPLEYNYYENGKLLYQHSYTKNLNIFTCTFAESPRIKHTLQFSEKDGVLYTANSRRSKGYITVGNMKLKDVVDGEIKTTADIEYNKNGDIVSGYVTTSFNKTVYQEIKDPVTDYVLELDRLKYSSSVFCVEIKAYNKNNLLIKRWVELRTKDGYKPIGISMEKVNKDNKLISEYYINVNTRRQGLVKLKLPKFKSYKHISTAYQKATINFVLATTC